MVDASGGATATAVIITGVVGFLTILGIFLFTRNHKNIKESKTTPSSSKPVGSVPPTGKSKKIKKKSKATGAVPASAPELAPVTPTPVEPTDSSKSKKKKKGGGGGGGGSAGEEPAVTPRSTTVDKEVEPPTPAPDPAPVSKSKKKKNKKNKSAAQSTPVVQSKFVPVTDDEDDSDDDMMEQAARLMAMKKKGNTKTTVTVSNANGSTTPAASTAKPKQSKPAAAEAETQQQPPTEVVLDIGPDPSLLIGPGGSIIQRITATSGARLDILKNTPEFGQNRVRITASEVAGSDGDDANTSIAKAVEMVQALLDEQAAIVANSKTVNLSSDDINGQAGVKAIIGRKGESIQNILRICNGEGNGSSAPGQVVKINANVEAGTVEISGPKLLVDKAVKLCKQAVFGETQASIKLQSRSAMNIVFGKDFSTIQEIQSTSGAKLDMDKETCTLKMSGKREEVDIARKAVTTLLDRCRGITMDVKSSDVGAVYGKGGATIRSIQDKTGAFIEVEQQPSSTSSDGESMFKCSIMGEPDACAQASVLISKALSREVELKPGEVAETLNLGGSSTPAVIGRGGSKIKELEAAHQVSLNVNGDVCKIVGKEANVKAAKEAIHAIIDPILATEAAEKQATKAAESGDTTWQAYDLPPEEDGW